VLIEFVVIGRPVPAGSKIRGRHGGIHDSSGHRGEHWRALVKATAVSYMSQYGLEPFTGPVRVEMVFQRQRPAKLSNPAHEWFPTMAPDVLKLARACEDSLTGVCYVDDALIVEERLRKVWASDWGVMITVEQIDFTDVLIDGKPFIGEQLGIGDKSDQ
jgi:Holliday junction resolvase RusA-like endonuclease